MANLYAFSRETVARIWRAVLYVERAFLAAGQPTARSRRLPRTYRRFTLTGTLNAGGSAAVTWPDDSTGTVWDRDTCCWGLTGETGEAYAVGTGTGVEWRVCKNPGQAVYHGWLTEHTTSSPAYVGVSISGKGLSLAANLRMLPPPGWVYLAGTGVYVGHSRGEWEIVSVLACPVRVED
jgi:hypothetical protein